MVAEPVLPAHEIAFRALDRLRRTDFSNLEELRLYYFEISEVLRAYVEARFGLNASDLTTEEILGRIGNIDGLSEVNEQRLCGFLEATDQVKYAAQVPSTAEIESTYEAALSFVEGTVPLVAESGEEEGGGPSAPPDERADESGSESRELADSDDPAGRLVAAEKSA